MHSLRQLFLALLIANQATYVAAAGVPAAAARPSARAVGSACARDIDCTAAASAKHDTTSVAVPAGTQPCPDSGAGAACGRASSPAAVAPGTASVPAGSPPCAAVTAKPLPSNTQAACAEPSTGDGSAPPPDSVIQPSVPVASLGPRSPDRLTLSADATWVSAGQPVTLTATANATVTGTGLAIEIFDATAHVAIGACGLGSQCSVSYTAQSGIHDVVAFVTPPTAAVPSGEVAQASNPISVDWIGVSLAANRTVAGPGRPLILTATSTVDVHDSGRSLELYDSTDGRLLTYCASGATCTTAMTDAVGGVHDMVARITGEPQAVSAPVHLTWLAVSLSATNFQNTMLFRATINADLTDTPWVVGIYDAQGRLVDHTCKTGSYCSVRGSMGGTYAALIGALPGSRSASDGKVVRPTPVPGQPDLVDVQARSAPMEPGRVLWGVDSCKAFTGDPTGELYPGVVSSLGRPDFWGRYLTDTMCPGISPAEAALAARNHMGILPIYNDYDCSNVSGYATGTAYANAAVAAALRLGIPQGRLLAIDIEPYGPYCPGAANVDPGFIEGWYDGVQRAGYMPAYYGNGAAGTEFASAWCATVSTMPEVAQGSALWSFEPSLIGGLNRSNAPDFSPYDTGCAGNIVAWQYQIDIYSRNPNVDSDEALSGLPLWYPS